MRQKSALILGSSGQDGAFLAKEFFDQGVRVHGVSRGFSNRLSNMGIPQTQLDISSESDFQKLLSDTNPDIVINLVSVSSVALCEKNPQLSEEINSTLVRKISSKVEQFADKSSREIHFVQASSSEMFGPGAEFCNELTPMNPLTTYGKHKLFAHEFLLKRTHRLVSYTSVILFNHESEFRPRDFVSAKVARAAAEVAVHGSTKIEFGNIQIKRDWGFAGDYMKAMCNISLERKHNCYVIASSELHSIQEMIRIAFETIGVSDYQRFVNLNSEYLRSVETPPIRGDNNLYKNEFGWKPAISFRKLVQNMVRYHIKEIKEQIQ
jgi:GDPmannose 4,6-dehydratase